MGGTVANHIGQAKDGAALEEGGGGGGECGFAGQLHSAVVRDRSVGAGVLLDAAVAFAVDGGAGGEIELRDAVAAGEFEGLHEWYGRCRGDRWRYRPCRRGRRSSQPGARRPIDRRGSEDAGRECLGRRFRPRGRVAESGCGREQRLGSRSGTRSMATISSPRASSASTKWLPMKPAAPVTSEVVNGRSPHWQGFRSRGRPVRWGYRR